MTTNFPHTLHALSSNRGKPLILFIFFAVVVITAWSIWFFFGRIGLIEISETARIEVSRQVHFIQTQVAGQVIKNNAVLDNHYQAGDVLVELDSEHENILLEEARSYLTTLKYQLNALQNEIEAQEKADQEEIQAIATALEEGRARYNEAKANLQFIKDKTDRTALLHQRGYVSELDLLQINAEKQKGQAEVEVCTLTIKRLEQEKNAKYYEQIANHERMNRENAKLKSEIAKGRTSIKQLENEIEKRRIRAPVDGRLGDIADYQVGSVIAKGQQLGAIVPDGLLKIVADFSPKVLRRIRRGQQARLRIEGFPWIENENLKATVVRIASEMRDGLIRVELAPVQDLETGMAFPHGLPVEVEVEVAQISPASFVLSVIN